jgi:hypothetical protein
MEMKGRNPIREDTVAQKDMPSIKNYFDKDSGEASETESVTNDMNMKMQLEAEALVEKYEKTA